jgi:hypothetical protein
VLVLAIAFAVALLIPLVTRGSYDRLLSVDWKWGGFLFSGLAIQIVLEYYTLPRARWDDLGLGLLLFSYVCILAFCARNLVLRGMGIVLIGVACNAVAITVNQGMPVKIPASWGASELTRATVKHQPQQPDDKLIFLTDIIVLNSPFDTVISFGDLIIAVGLCDVAYHASRRRKSRRRTAIDLPAIESETAATPDIDLVLDEPDAVVAHDVILMPDAGDEPPFVLSADEAPAVTSGNGNGVAHDVLEGTNDARVVDVRGS